jgi:hypothetical protein
MKRLLLVPLFLFGCASNSEYARNICSHDYKPYSSYSECYAEQLASRERAGEMWANSINQINSDIVARNAAAQRSAEDRRMLMDAARESRRVSCYDLGGGITHCN